jgi:hypothetical protein
MPRLKFRRREDVILTHPSSDAFTKREAASEELYIRQEEKAKYVYISPTGI